MIGRAARMRLGRVAGWKTMIDCEGSTRGARMRAWEGSHWICLVEIRLETDNGRPIDLTGVHKVECEGRIV